MNDSAHDFPQVWDVNSAVPSLQHTFDCGEGAVLAVVVRGDTVYAGCQDGYVKVLDLETRTLVRTIIVNEVGRSETELPIICVDTSHRISTSCLFLCFSQISTLALQTVKYK